MRNFAQSRLITLLKATAFLLDRPHTPVTSAEFMREIGEVSQDTQSLDDTQRRAFERIKEDLRDLGVPLETVNLDDQSLYRIQERQYALRNLGLSSQEEVVLSFIARLLAEEEGFPLRGNLGLALQKISAVTANPIKPNGENAISGSPSPVEPRQNPEILDRLVAAGGEHHPVSFKYSSFHSETTTQRNVEPYGFFTRRGVWYLVGRDIDTDNIKVFRVSRIPVKRSVKVDTTKTFDIPSDFQLKDYASIPPWNFLIEKEEQAVSVEIDTEEFWRVREFCQAHGQVDESQEGIVRWNLKARDFDPLIKWMLPFGVAIRPAQPRAFVERYRAVVKETLAHYGR